MLKLKEIRDPKAWFIIGVLLLWVGLVIAGFLRKETEGNLTGTSDIARGAALFFVIVFGYLLPWLIARHRHHRDAGTIAVITVLLGWTVIGWIVALAWACSGNVERRAPGGS